MKKLALTTAAAILATVLNVTAADNEKASHSVTISIPEVALLDLEGGASVTLTPAKPTEAGEGLNFAKAADNSTWVNYSSVVAKNKSRNVTVAITSGKVPAGLNLKVAAGTYSGSGKGTFGTSEGVVTLSGDEQNVVTGVGSCYTGTGTSNGHQLAYSLELTNADAYSSLEFADNTVTVTYTLKDDN